MTTANKITISRVPLLLLVAALVYYPGPKWLAFVNGLLIIALVLLDWFDGFYARTNGQVTRLGGILDIAVDRVVENTLWLVFACKGEVAFWIPVIFIIRSFLVDGVRGFALSKGKTAFGMMASPWGKFLVAGRFMRGLYGFAKAAAFVALAIRPTEGVFGLIPEPAAGFITSFLVYLAPVLCIARGIPVIMESRDLLKDAS